MTNKNTSKQREMFHKKNTEDDIICGNFVLPFNGECWIGPGLVRIRTRRLAEDACKRLSENFKGWKPEGVKH